MIMRDKVQGARNEKHETYHIDRRVFEYRATPQFARRVILAAST